MVLRSDVPPANKRPGCQCNKVHDGSNKTTNKPGNKLAARTRHWSVRPAGAWHCFARRRAHKTSRSSAASPTKANGKLAVKDRAMQSDEMAEATINVFGAFGNLKKHQTGTAMAQRRKAVANPYPLAATKKSNRKGL